MKKIYTVLFLCCSFSLTVRSQTALPMPDSIPTMRQLFHDNIAKSQLTIIHLNSPDDTVFAASKNIDINLQINQLLKVHINNLQAKIETDSSFNTSDKYLWLRAIDEMLGDFISGYKAKNIRGVLLGDLITAFEDAMNAQLLQQSILPIIKKNKLDVDNILLNSIAFKNNVNINEAKYILTVKFCARYPDKILGALTKFPEVLPFADSLINVVAYRQPEELYNYAAASNALGEKIRNAPDALPQLISQMAMSENGRQYFPFLDNLLSQKITIDSINNVLLSSDSNAYYKLLVATEIEYAGRIKNDDIPLVKNVLATKLRSVATDTYINEINALHDVPSDAVRFKKLDSLAPQELYYLCVIAEEEIYTSSYLGVYKRMFKRMKEPKSDILLQMVNNDFYKKFIKMAASYNELDDFLGRMDRADAENLIKSFVSNLDETNSLEDAVDVADSYASINDAGLRKLILAQIEENYKTSDSDQNDRGKIIYQLLFNIFKSDENIHSASDVPPIDLPPVYNMPISMLKDSSTGKIIVQQFFYGDKDGVNIFNSFASTFNTGNWKVVKKPEWTETISTKGVPIVIYSNRPLDETKDLDAEAQSHLTNYLDSLNSYPTVIIHRGHSYYVNSTIHQLPVSAKVILLGSCGGYNSLNTVLSICPDAHIIASKQVGTGIVNIALIQTMMETLRQGKNLDWPLMWKNMQNKFSGDYKEKFSDYVPPYKNLGAMFMMAYDKAIETENAKEDDENE